VISNITATSVSATSETITWTTNVPATSQVIYGQYSDYGSSTPLQDTAGVTSHSVTISGLMAQTGYGYVVISRGISGGAAQDYLISFSALDSLTFTTGSPTSTGTFAFSMQGVGPHNIVQGFPLYVVVYNWYVSGVSGFNPGSMKFQVTGLPANTQVHWPDVQDDGCTTCGAVSTTTTTNDTFTSSSGPGINAQFEILTNVGGTTPVGSYTLTVTATTNGGTGPSQSFTWPLNVGTASFPSGSPSIYPTIPSLALWQSNMTTYGNTWAGTATAGCTECVEFYDGAWVYDQISQYTGTSTPWVADAAGVTTEYRDDFVLADPGGVSGIQVFPHGLYYGCTVNSVTASCTALHDLASEANGAQMLANTSAYEDAIYVREGCYMLGAKRLDYDAGGATTLAAVKQMAAYCLGYEDMIVNGYTGFEQPFMDGLMAQALIEYYLDPKTGNGDVRVPPAIKALADYMWTNDWLPWQGTNGMFFYNKYQYNSHLVNGSNYSLASDLESLNLLIAPIYAWLYQQTGQAQYQLEGDTLWYSGVNDPPGSGIGFTGKNFSQQYRWSFDYVSWRSAP
jgi:hypothetical protein